MVDEADHMADLGFLPDRAPAAGRDPAGGPADAVLRDPRPRRRRPRPPVPPPSGRARVDPPAAPAPIVHHLLTVAPADRTAVVTALGRRRQAVADLHADQARRTQARPPAHRRAHPRRRAARQPDPARPRAQPRAFDSGRSASLVATDIAARGIHVDGIDLVIHADPPAEHKAYLHRSGRTARAGASGVVVTLQTPAQAGDVRALMRKARVVPLAATVNPGSALLRSIAGKPAEPPAPQPARLRGTGNRPPRQPGNRPRRGRHVCPLPRPPRALTRSGPRRSEFCSVSMSPRSAAARCCPAAPGPGVTTHGRALCHAGRAGDSTSS